MGENKAIFGKSVTVLSIRCEHFCLLIQLPQEPSEDAQAENATENFKCDIQSSF